MDSANKVNCALLVLNNPQNKLDEYFAQIKKMKADGDHNFDNKLYERHVKFIK